MNDITFRRAVGSDLVEIVPMLADDELGQFREDDTTPLNPAYVEAFSAINKDPNQRLIVVEDGGSIVGCLQLTFVPGLARLGMTRGQVESVRIANKYRGKGLGRKMMEWAITECRAHGCQLVQLTTDKCRENAREFYESLGFVASHEGMKLRL